MFGGIVPSVARSLKEGANKAEAARQKLDSMRNQSGPELIPALLSSSSGAMFAWKEQTFDVDGVRYEKIGGRYGTTNWDIGVMPDRSEMAVPLGGIEVWLRPTIHTARYGLVHEIVAGAVAGAGPGVRFYGPDGVTDWFIISVNRDPAWTVRLPILEEPPLTTGYWLVQGAVVFAGVSSGLAFYHVSVRPEQGWTATYPNIMPRASAIDPLAIVWDYIQGIPVVGNDGHSTITINTTIRLSPDDAYGGNVYLEVGAYPSSPIMPVGGTALARASWGMWRIGDFIV